MILMVLVVFVAGLYFADWLTKLKRRFMRSYNYGSQDAEINANNGFTKVVVNETKEEGGWNYFGLSGDYKTNKTTETTVMVHEHEGLFLNDHYQNLGPRNGRAALGTKPRGMMDSSIALLRAASNKMICGSDE